MKVKYNKERRYYVNNILIFITCYRIYKNGIGYRSAGLNTNV